MRAWLAALACAAAAGCAAPAERRAVEVFPCAGRSVDSVRAARLANDAFRRVDDEYPLRVLKMRRDGCAWHVVLVPDVEGLLGGGGLVRVDSVGGAAVLVRHQ